MMIPSTDRRRWLAICLAWGLAGCVTTGRDFDATHVKHIEDGLTPRAQIIDWFGQPEKREAASPNPKGIVLRYYYGYSTSYALASTKREKVLIVGFDADDVVVTHEYRDGRISVFN